MEGFVKQSTIGDRLYHAFVSLSHPISIEHSRGTLEKVSPAKFLFDH